MSDGNDVARVFNACERLSEGCQSMMKKHLQVGDEKHGQAECGVEIEAHQAKCAEEALHDDICDIVEQMEGKKRPR